MSDREFLDSDELEGSCPSYFWYLIGSFGYTALISLILVAYLIMYSNHFIWALRRNPRPSLKKGGGKKASIAKRVSDKSESAMKGASQTDDASQLASQQKESKDLNMPDVTA